MKPVTLRRQKNSHSFTVKCPEELMTVIHKLPLRLTHCSPSQRLAFLPANWKKRRKDTERERERESKRAKGLSSLLRQSVKSAPRSLLSQRCWGEEERMLGENDSGWLWMERQTGIPTFLWMKSGLGSFLHGNPSGWIPNAQSGKSRMTHSGEAGWIVGQTTRSTGNGRNHSQHCVLLKRRF